jgi:hypothetical protein
VISPIPLGLDSEAVSSASPRLWAESSSPDTILGHKSNCLESQQLGSPDIAVLNSVLLRAVARRSTPPYGGGASLAKLTHLSRGSRRGRPARARAWPPQWGSVRVGSVCVAGRVSDRGRQPRSQSRAEAGPLPWGPDPTGGSAAASGPPGRTGPPRGRCGGGCGGRLRYRTLHYANARVRTPTDHGLSVSIPISGVSA